MLWFQWLAWLFPVLTSRRKAPIRFKYFWFQNKSNVFPRRLSLQLSVMLTKGRKCISRLYFLEVNAECNLSDTMIIAYSDVQKAFSHVSLYLFLFCFQGLARFSWNILKWTWEIVLRVFSFGYHGLLFTHFQTSPCTRSFKEECCCFFVCVYLFSCLLSHFTLIYEYF